MATITKLRKVVAETWDADQHALAQACRISDTLLSDFICGGRPIHPAHHLINLSRILQRNPRDLIGTVELEQV